VDFDLIRSYGWIHHHVSKLVYFVDPTPKFRVLGMAILVVGVCTVLWGKEGDIDEEENIEEKFVEIVKCCNRCDIKVLSMMPRIDEEVDVEMQSAGTAKVAVGFS
jgi:hypothetical protein